MSLELAEIAEDCLERIQALENDVRETKNRVEELQRQLQSASTGTKQQTVAEIAEELGLREHLPALKTKAESLFGVPVAISVGKFPEFPEDKYLVFELRLPKKSVVEDVVARKFQWHEAVVDTVPTRGAALCLEIRYE